MKKISFFFITFLILFHTHLSAYSSDPRQFVEELINDAINKGYSFIILGSDLFVLSEWSRTMKKTIRSLKNEK